mmetsp:Transcript_43882/g.133657  ORF Transcript_43882/g.133657 Transcript_43882/m.133657 type:complete len:103 (+) Transcript_43882:965-1273(+)
MNPASSGNELFALTVSKRMEFPPNVFDWVNELLESGKRRVWTSSYGTRTIRRPSHRQQAKELETKRKETDSTETKMKARRQRLAQYQLLVQREGANRFASKL